MTVLIVVAMMLMFLTIDWMVRRREKQAGVVQPVTMPMQPLALRYPGGIFFTKSHTWLNLFPTGIVRLGVDDFICRLMKKPQIEFLKRTGTQVQRGEPMLRLSDGTHTLTVRSPLTGTIVRVNENVREHSEVLHESLFAEGWAFSIEPDSVRELRDFFIGDESQAWIREELGRLRDFLAGADPKLQLVPSFMQDGGISVEGALNGVNEEGWKRFETEFLSVDR